jgi:hypothetical protein
VIGSTDRHAPLVEREPEIALDPRNAFSWPIATSTSSQGKVHVGLAGAQRAAGALSRRAAGATFSNVTPVSLPLSCVKNFGTRKIVDRECLRGRASSFSHGDAFISS